MNISYCANSYFFLAHLSLPWLSLGLFIIIINILPIKVVFVNSSTFEKTRDPGVVVGVVVRLMFFVQLGFFSVFYQSSVCDVRGALVWLIQCCTLQISLPIIDNKQLSTYLFRPWSSLCIIMRNRSSLYFIIPPSEKSGYIGVTVSGCLSVSVGRLVGSHILSGLFLTNHWVEFNRILHEAFIPRGDVHILKG